jgi:hypothetical protein
MSSYFSSVYEAKIDACVRATEMLRVKVKDILSKYRHETMPDSNISREDLFLRIMNKASNEGDYDYITNKCNLVHHMDSRTPFEYGVDLVLGWVIEDAAIFALSQKGQVAVLSGEDRYREFLNPRKISTQPDIRLSIKGRDRYIEIFADWKGTWGKQNHADLRDNKYNKLLQENAILFGISPIDQTGFVIDMEVERDLFVEGFIPAYRKQGYIFKGIRSRLEPLNVAVSKIVKPV